jgi:Holliday junction resolvase RusA-like endonuclease
MITVKLPLPPSLNNAFFNLPKGGRAPSRAYKQWMASAGWDLKAQRPASLLGPYEAHIILPKMPANSDPDNRVKPLLDLLVTHKITPDDKHCRKITIERDDTAALVTMTVKPCEGA